MTSPQFKNAVYPHYKAVGAKSDKDFKKLCYYTQGEAIEAGIKRYGAHTPFEIQVITATFRLENRYVPGAEGQGPISLEDAAAILLPPGGQIVSLTEHFEDEHGKIVDPRLQSIEQGIENRYPRAM